MSDSHSVQPQPVSGVNLLAGGDQPLVVDPSARPASGSWSSRILRGVLAVALVGSAGAYGALRANPNLANYIPLASTVDRTPEAHRDSCPLTGGCPLSASTPSRSSCCSAALKALAEASATADELVTGVSASCPRCPLDTAAPEEVGDAASADGTPAPPSEPEDKRESAAAQDALETPPTSEPADSPVPSAAQAAVTPTADVSAID